MAELADAWEASETDRQQTKEMVIRIVNADAADVRSAWANGRVPDNEVMPNPRHHDAKHGPNLYQVNEHYIKPLTLAAGGMSYALMKHPEGLDCEVFVSHSWCEGLFQLSNSIRRAWPQLEVRRNLYCCLLANPQNLDISSLLDVAPENSPFAKALQQASHLLVVPNSTVGVYSRLWCVYEAYLGSVFKKTYLLPVKPRNSARKRVMIRTVLLPIILGLLLGLFWEVVRHHLTREVETKVLLWSCFIEWASMGILLLAASTVVAGPDGEFTTCMAVIYYLFIFSVVLGWSLVMPWFHATLGYEYWYVFLLHFGVPGNMAVISTACVALFGQIYLEGEELLLQREMLHFDSVRNARCSNPRDEERIRRAIEGKEAEVDAVIRILSIAGAYNENLRREWDEGIEISGSGFTDLTCNTIWAMFIWGASAAAAIADVILWPDLAPWMSGASAIVCLGTMVAIPFTIKFLCARGPDRAVFALRIWIQCAVVSMIVPTVVAFAQGFHEATCLSLTALFSDDFDKAVQVHPSKLTAASVSISRFFFAAAGALCAVHGPASWNRYWLAGIRKRRSKTLRTDELQGEVTSQDSSEVSDSSVESSSERPSVMAQFSRLCSFKV
ncbi:hypothetical protein AK812_SmicGene566 [Symbiodinium microadriaticum]|uniref:Uncharacterized protein n=1 Tax=Symbiodinium microadriaticum TaxID=2951 RepID=A0A1Q9F6H9_SYMMI|nr:hypothetical protein AK812_SmicGene566 [Symbiodinium microadriaticum]